MWKGLILAGVLLLLTFSVAFAQEGGQGDTSQPWRLLIADARDEERGTYFWLNADGSQEVVYTAAPIGLDVLSDDLQYGIRRVEDSTIIFYHLPSATFASGQATAICENCYFSNRQPYGAFSPDGTQFAAGFREDSLEGDIPGGFAIFDVQTGALLRHWRIDPESHSLSTQVYVGDWDEDGLFYFTWCYACDGSPYDTTGYRYWNLSTNETARSNRFFSYLTNFDLSVLPTTGEIVNNKAITTLPYTADMTPSENAIVYESPAIDPTSPQWREEMIIFHDSAYTFIEEPSWVMNGDAVYIQASGGANYVYWLLFRDGQRVPLTDYPGYAPMLMTQDGWLAAFLIDGDTENRTLTHVRFAEGQLFYEPLLVLTQSMQIVRQEILQPLTPQQPNTFTLAETPPLTQCYRTSIHTPETFSPPPDMPQAGRVVGQQAVEMYASDDPGNSNAFAQIPVGEEFAILDAPSCYPERWLVMYEGQIGWSFISEISRPERTYFERIPPPPFDGTCPGFIPSRLQVGGLGRVTPGDANNLRSIPHPEAQLVGQIPGEGVFRVLRGPVCYNDTAYWKVAYADLIGWTAEGSGSTYWLEPWQ